MEKRNNISIPQMLAKLDELYEKESELFKQMERLKNQYTQLLEDKEMLQNMIMYASNKASRR